MKAAHANTVSELVPKRKRGIQQTELNAVERRRLEDLILRFQRVVVERNLRLGQRLRAGVNEPEMIRAALVGLEQIEDDEQFYKAVIKAQDRQ